MHSAKRSLMFWNTWSVTPNGEKFRNVTVRGKSDPVQVYALNGSRRESGHLRLKVSYTQDLGGFNLLSSTDLWMLRHHLSDSSIDRLKHFPVIGHG